MYSAHSYTHTHAASKCHNSAIPSRSVLGLQGFTAESMEVRTVISSLAAKMAESEGIFEAKDIGAVLQYAAINI